VIGDERLAIRDHRGLVSVLPGKLTHVNLSEVALYGLDDELLACLVLSDSRGRHQQCNPDAGEVHGGREGIRGRASATAGANRASLAQYD